MDGSTRIALRISRTLDTYTHTRDRHLSDMVTGMVIAYGLLINEHNYFQALVKALNEASEYYEAQPAR